MRFEMNSDLLKAIHEKCTTPPQGRTGHPCFGRDVNLKDHEIQEIERLIGHAEDAHRQYQQLPQYRGH